ncbi:beta-ketoacyl synthase N-terminal-like domain-containing protein [Actinomadura sp. WMMA1423]|uniref:beta-ketoacyl synthase N-terminal-like domain-containing protein n=1 Tax=Actinomadura sp. WMMA1423 TaxID=2591108 RepID=UPI0011469A00|nr:beta-ketoacyl synthase N-terminal-like domain-containing protein [Actinomadura sp. WMMA1423]
MSTAISAMALMSPAGVGAGPFGEAVRAGTPLPGGAVEDFRTEAPDPSARPVRLVDRPSAMALAAIADLLGGDVLEGWPPHRRALVLGSGAAGIDQSMTLTRDSLTRPRPDNVNPALVPACVMNYASAQAAMAFDLQGPNATVTAGGATGLAALRYARRLLAAGRADAVVCGAYEDLNDRRAAIAEAAGRAGRPAEGCAVFLVESAGRARSRGRPVLAEVLALESGVFDEPGQAHDVLGAAVHRALRTAGADLEDVGVLVPSGPEDARMRVPARTRVVRFSEIVGDAFGAAGALQVAAAIAVSGAGRERAAPDPAGGLALITTIDSDGHAGCCLLRTGGRGGPGA